MKQIVRELKKKSFLGKFAKNYTEGCNIKHLHIKDGEESGNYLTIKFADYTSIDDDDDLMLQGAFTKSFEVKNGNRDVAFCWQHDTSDPIGKIIDFWEDEKGAYVKVKLSDFDVVPNAKRAWGQVTEGVINQASFGFRYVWDAVKWVSEDETDRNRGHYAVGEVKLFEVSLVTLGCNAETEVLYTNEVEKSFLLEQLKGEEKPERKKLSITARLGRNN